MDKTKINLKNFFAGPFVTITLVALNVLVYLWLTLAGGSTDLTVLVTHGAMVPAMIKDGAGWASLFTSMFVHIGFEHLLFNMITLYFIGRLLEQVIGHGRFLLIYLLSGIFANVVSLAFAAPNSISAGASGAIFGIIGVWIMMAEQYRNYPFLAGMGRQMLIFSALGIVSGMFGTSIDIFAHLGGLVAGFLLGYGFSFPNLGKVPLKKRLGSGVLLLILLGVFVKLAFTL